MMRPRFPTTAEIFTGLVVATALAAGPASAGGPIYELVTPTPAELEKLLLTHTMQYGHDFLTFGAGGAFSAVYPAYGAAQGTWAVVPVRPLGEAESDAKPTAVSLLAAGFIGGEDPAIWSLRHDVKWLKSPGATCLLLAGGGPPDVACPKTTRPVLEVWPDEDTVVMLVRGGDEATYQRVAAATEAVLVAGTAARKQRQQTEVYYSGHPSDTDVLARQQDEALRACKSTLQTPAKLCAPSLRRWAETERGRWEHVHALEVAEQLAKALPAGWLKPGVTAWPDAPFSVVVVTGSGSP